MKRKPFIDQILLANHVLPVADQIFEQVEYLRSNRERFRPAMQLATVGVEYKVLEVVAQSLDPLGACGRGGLPPVGTRK
jgi:hypothetical protein